jgi:hypothetical protein
LQLPIKYVFNCKIKAVSKSGNFRNKNISKEIKNDIFHNIVEIIPVYGGEMWPLPEK